MGEIRNPTAVYDPRTERFVDVDDRRDEFKRDSLPVPANVLDAWLTNRRESVWGYLLRAALGLRKPQKAAAGVYFLEGILGFKEHTAIYWYAIAPRILGDHSTANVFLTSSNQAVVGAEVFLQYQNPTEGRLSVYDWDQKAYVLYMDYSKWSKYLQNVTLGSAVHQGVYMTSQTREIGALWRNEVLLENPSSGRFDSIWSHDFPFTPPTDPRLNRVWGPIIEPSSPYDFGTTNLMGYADARLVSDFFSGRLVPGKSDLVYRKKKNFTITHLDDFYAMLAE
jgi:hypothetical protein